MLKKFFLAKIEQHFNVDNEKITTCASIKRTVVVLSAILSKNLQP